MTNSQMTANRFAHWARARKIINTIQAEFAKGNSVIVSTMTKATKFSPKHAAMFKATKSGAYAQYGKNWLCIDYCRFQVVSNAR